MTTSRRRKRAKKDNPVLEYRKSQVGGRAVGETTPAQAYDALSSYMRIIRRDNPTAPGAFIEVATAEGPDGVLVSLAFFVINALSNEADDAPSNDVDLTERAEWAKEHAALIVRDELVVHMEDEPDEPGPREHARADQGAAVERALLPLRNVLDMYWPISVNGKLMELREALGGRRICISYETFTPESIEEGEAEERGWENYRGVSMENEDYVDDPREDDLEDTPVQRAVDFLRHEGADEPSSSHFHSSPIWYIASGDIADFRTATTTQRSFHLVNFDLVEERDIFRTMTGGRRWTTRGRR